MDKIEKQNLIILGMHRSGTSLISRWLYTCGLNIGENLVEGDIGNEDGHFEDWDFVNLHEKILNQHQLPASGLTDKVLGQLTIEEETLILNIVNDKSRNTQWGWKDPRTCLFLDTYRKLLPNAKYIIVLRDYNLVVWSLINRDLKKQRKAYFKDADMLRRVYWTLKNKSQTQKYLKRFSSYYMNVWINYNKNILKHLLSINSGDFILVSYQMLLEEEDKIFNFLRNKWGFQLEPKSFAHIYNPAFISATQNISHFIEQQFLINEADFLFNSLKEYEFIKSIVVDI